MLTTEVPELSLGSIPSVVLVSGEFRARKMKVSERVLLYINSIEEIFWIDSIESGDLFDR